MLRRAVKIIATVGPACSDPAKLAELIGAGVDLFRFNFAHGTREEHAARIKLVHELGVKQGRAVGTLADISGPKIRLGKIPGDSAMLNPGEIVSLCSPEASGEGLPVQLPNFCDYVQAGDPIYLSDGTRKLILVDCAGGIARAKVEVGGAINSFKGINLPNLRKPLPVVGAKDLQDVEYALKAGIDWIGLSFVSTPEDILPLRELMTRIQIKRPVLAKLERQQALEKLDEIIYAFDGVMVARGDLGIEVAFERVPVIQNRILEAARRQGKPAIVATQILTSMVNSPRPTRAEVTDIAYAVSAGADALMLSEETAMGSYPVEAVQTIVKVAREIEAVPITDPMSSDEHLNQELALAHTAVILARDTGAAAILCATHSGNAARSVARFRPHAPIVVVSDAPHRVGELTLFRGVHPQLTNLGDSLDSRIKAALRYAGELGLLAPNAKLVIVGGVPAGSGRTNLLLVHTVPQSA